MTFRLQHHHHHSGEGRNPEPRNEERSPRLRPSTPSKPFPIEGEGVTQRGLPSPQRWSERWLCGRLMHR